MPSRLALPLIGLLLASTAEAGSTLRCGSKLISLEDHVEEVAAKCGAPARRDFLGYKEVVDYYGFVTQVALEEWVYGPKNGMLYFLRFEGNRVTKIESKRGR
ncbi:Protein of unknown function [Aquipseudomonas alcaligenes]|uniref:DUF2845 domain-containing protein n=1 Tax=Aquipseudomonas alcaligenes TaxID=43263 RepID=A0A1N7G0W7_AQUAC|nr:DUF2845 domain-containing protein [Pseudomonas alcaligenes]SIQ22742.1 Protein of unknown function [Pseudomonas alcaligenes]SIS06198.1 Protein of unknown function [Pseudomonas alcaligenes]